MIPYPIVANVSVLRAGRWFQTMGGIEIAICGVEAMLVALHDSMTTYNKQISLDSHSLNIILWLGLLLLRLSNSYLHTYYSIPRYGQSSAFDKTNPSMVGNRISYLGHKPIFPRFYLVFLCPSSQVNLFIQNLMKTNFQGCLYRCNNRFLCQHTLHKCTYIPMYVPFA